MSKLLKLFPFERADFVGGITTFLTVSYILAVNPAILSTPGTGLSFEGVLTATVVLIVSMTLLMGVYARLPYAVAPGMGVNAFFTYSLILGQGIPAQDALGLVFLAGVLFLAVSATPLRVVVAQAIPDNLRVASSVGIGLFLTFIGLKSAGLVVHDPVTLLRFGNPLERHTLAALLGLIVGLWLFMKRYKLAFLLSIVTTTVATWLFGLVELPSGVLAWPNFHDTFFTLDVGAAIKGCFSGKYLGVLFAILFTDLFDSISTFVGVARGTYLVNADKEPLRLREGLIVDAWATLVAGVVGTSSGTAYIESAAGIEAGGRRGRAAIVTALCFVPCLFFAPVLKIIPESATAPVLIIIGGLMFRTIREIKLNVFEEMFPAFLTIVLIPLTFSITQGILWGFISHVLLFLFVGRRKDIHFILYILSAISVALILTSKA